MERRKVMTIAAVLISVMVAAGACGKMMGDAPAPAEKAGVSSGDRKAPADSTEKAEAGTADTEKNEKERIKNRVRRRHRPNRTGCSQRAGSACSKG